MYCRNCGIEVDENAEYCIGCGVAPLNGDKHCDNCGVNTNENQEICIKCGVKFKKEQNNESEWYNSTGWLIFWLLIFWPVAVYGWIKRDKDK